MVKLNSVIVTFALKMKEIVILMMSVKMVFSVDQTIVQLHLVLTQNLIAVINQLLAMNIFVQLEFLAEKMKEIVILMMSVKMVFSVDQTIVQLHLVLTQNLIAVINQLLAMNIFVQLEFLVEKMKEIVIKVSGAKGLLVTRPPIFLWFLEWTSCF